MHSLVLQLYKGILKKIINNLPAIVKFAPPIVFRFQNKIVKCATEILVQVLLGLDV